MSLPKKIQQEVNEMIDKVFPGAIHVKESDEIDLTCGCYSEWTTEPCRVDMEYKVPFTYEETTGKALPLEDALEKYLQRKLDYDGCDCCRGYLSVWFRFIPDVSVRRVFDEYN